MILINFNCGTFVAAVLLLVVFSMHIKWDHMDYPTRADPTDRFSLSAKWEHRFPPEGAEKYMPLFYQDFWNVLKSVKKTRKLSKPLKTAGNLEYNSSSFPCWGLPSSCVLSGKQGAVEA